MIIGKYVYITNPDKELYRRRCRIIKIDDTKEEEETTYLVFSEGLEEEEWICLEDFEISQY